MTEVYIASDLHIDVQMDLGDSLIDSFPVADIGVFAGDLCEVRYLKDTLTKLCEAFPQVIYVPGNHEYYHSTWSNVEKVISDAANKLGNLHWLHDSKIKVDGINFIGSTLWFPNSRAVLKNKSRLNDFRFIREFEPEVYNRFAASVEYFKNNIEDGDWVVTHHSPSHQSVPLRFKGSEINCFFANHLEYLIYKNRPAKWIHGHHHNNCDYMLGPTHVYCNPHGYLHENQEFNCITIRC